MGTTYINRAPDKHQPAIQAQVARDFEPGSEYGRPLKGRKVINFSMAAAVILAFLWFVAQVGDFTFDSIFLGLFMSGLTMLVIESIEYGFFPDRD